MSARISARPSPPRSTACTAISPAPTTSATSTVRNRVVLTNKTPTGLNRGFGGPQVYYALERLMQRIAVELKLDPLDVIRRNLVPAGAFPYRDGDRRAARFRRLSGRVAPAVDGGRARRIAGAPRSGARGGPALRHRLCRGGRAERLQHGLHHDRADARGAPQGRAEERRAGDRHDRLDPLGARVGACRLGAAGAGPSHRGGAGRRRRARPEAAGHPRRRRHGHRQGRLVDRVGQLFEPLRARGRAAPLQLAAERLRDQLARLAAAQLNVSPAEIVFAGGRVARARQSGQRALPFARVAAAGALGARHARPTKRSGDPRDRVLDAAAN